MALHDDNLLVFLGFATVSTIALTEYGYDVRIRSPPYGYGKHLDRTSEYANSPYEALLEIDMKFET